MLKLTTFGAAALAVAVGTTMAVGQVSTFVILPPAPGHVFLQPYGISGDGTTVFGESGLLIGSTSEAYRWTAALGGQNIGALLSGPFSEATASSTDGTKLYGRDDDNDGFVWTAPGSVAHLFGGAVVDVSGDGAVRITRTERFAPDAQLLPPLAGDQNTVCESISADGSAVALTSHFFQSGGGYGYGGGPDIVRDQACRWTTAGGTQGCGFLPGTNRSFATCISENGAVVLGVSRSGNGGQKRGFRWTSAGGMSELLPINGQATPINVEPMDSSADGSIVVCDVDGEAMVWTEAQGFRSVKQLLLASGWDIGAWTFYSVVGVSDDGTVITGKAFDEQGQFHSYVTPLSAVCAGPSNPWTATRRVILAEGDALPGGGVAGSVNEITVNTAGAALVRVGGDLWKAGHDGTLQLVVAGAADGFESFTTATMNDAGVIAAARGRSQTIAPLQTEFVRTVAVGTPGAMTAIASHGMAAPAAGGGGTLRTYGDLYGPLMSNGRGASSSLACFQCGIDGGTGGGVRAFVYDPAAPAGLVRSVPAVSITAPVLHGISDGGIVVRTAQEGVLAGGPPPLVEDVVATVGGAAPGIVGGTFSSFSDVGVNGAGTVVFAAAVNSPGGFRDTVYTRAPGGAPQLVVMEGMEVSPGVTVVGINRAKISSTGSVYFTGFLSDGREALVKARATGGMVIAAAQGDAAPGAGPCRAMQNFGLLGVDNRRVLFSATVFGPSGSASALVTWGEGEGASIVARSGETVTLRPGLTGQVAGAFLSVLNGNGQDGQPSALRGDHLIYTVQLTTPGGTRRVVVGDDLPALPCGNGDVGAAGGVIGADGFLDNNDFIAFITLFFAADARADFGTAGGIPGQDGAFDNNDFIAFITAFFAGCS